MTKIFTLVAQIMFMKLDTCQLCGKVRWGNMGYHCAADFIPWELLSLLLGEPSMTLRFLVSQLAKQCMECTCNFVGTKKWQP